MGPRVMALSERAKGSPTSQAEPSGEDFMAWLTQGVRSRKLIINDAKALVHTGAGTAYLVSPGIFQRYAQEHPQVAAIARQEKLEAWQWVQKRFEKLGAHRKQGSGVNIWTCDVTGPRKSRRLHGYLLPRPEALFGEVPTDNPYEYLPGRKMDVTSSEVSTAIRVAVLGEWGPSQLADVLALQRAEEPETAAALVEYAGSTPSSEVSHSDFDFALSPADVTWPGWVCEPLWHDTLAVAVAKRSHLLAHRDVPCHELQKQPLICAQSTADEPWQALVHRLIGDEPTIHEEVVRTFDMAMTLVAAGYGIAIGPAARLAGYQCRGIAMPLLASAPPIVMAYLLHTCAALTERQERFARRVRSVS